MNVNALLMCREQEALQMLVGALDELEIEEEICVSEPEAMELLAVGYYSAVVVDFDLPGAAQVARLARLLPAQRRPVVFALINALTDVGSAFQAGANFVLYKPLVCDQVMRSLRAGRAFMRPDRRRSPGGPRSRGSVAASKPAARQRWGRPPAYGCRRNSRPRTPAPDRDAGSGRPAATRSSAMRLLMPRPFGRRAARRR